MLSVIVPTMWYAEKFCEFLSEIVQLSVVDEIIIINNNAKETPDHDVLQNSKIKMHNMPENIYVAPSWNLGAKLAKNEVLSFLSDDVIVNLNVFEKAYKFIIEHKEKIGAISTLTDDVNDHSYFKFFKNDEIEFYDISDSSREIPPSTGMGNLFFILKDVWVDIPEQIKIFHGEALLWNYYSKFKKNFVIADCFIETDWHVTWNKLGELDNDNFSKILEEDNIFCDSINYDLTKLEKYNMQNNTPKIYESPDKGQTVYERDFGADPSTRQIVKTAVQQQWNITFKGEEVTIPQNLASLV